MMRDNVYLLGSMLLAAGESRRFSGIKQLASLGDKYMLQQSINRLHAIQCHTRLLILGANAQIIRTQIDPPKTVEILEIEDWRKGISASIQAGVEVLSGHSHILILLADQPDVSVHDINRLVTQSRQYPDKIICARYADKNAVPAIFPASDYALLLNLKGDKGAGKFLNHPDFQQRVITVPLAHGAFDIDTQQDLNRWQQTKKDRA